MNTTERFINAIAECGQCSTTDAAKVLTWYLKEKIAKIDSINGSFTVKHGAFMDKDVIQRAIQVTTTK